MSNNYSTTHYSFDYMHVITKEEIATGYVKIKVDPYFVGNVWKLGSKDESGTMFHNLKTIARFGVKNDKKREVEAILNQTVAYARVNNFSVADTLKKLIETDKEALQVKAEVLDLIHAITLNPKIIKALPEKYTVEHLNFLFNKL